MEIRATTEAQDWIRERGGCLYLWDEPVSDAFAVDRVATQAPPGREFDVHYLGRFSSVALDVELEPPKLLEIGVRGRPFHGLAVRWDGDPWGTRGGLGYDG